MKVGGWRCLDRECERAWVGGGFWVWLVWFGLDGLDLNLDVRRVCRC